MSEQNVDLTAIAPMLDVYEKAVDAANKDGYAIKDLTSGRNERISTFLNESDDDKVKEWREWAAKVDAQIAEAQRKREARKAEVEEYVTGQIFGEGGEVDVEALKKEFANKRKAATDMRKALTVMVGGLTAHLGVDAEAALKAELDKRGVTEVVGLRGQSTGTTGGTKRPRLSEAYVNGEPVPVGTKGMPTFTTMAQYISKEYGATNANDLKAAAFKAAGTEDLSEVAGNVEFTFHLPAVFEGKSKDVSISVTPKTTDSESESVNSAEEAEEEE